MFFTILESQKCSVSMKCATFVFALVPILCESMNEVKRESGESPEQSRCCMPCCDMRLQATGCQKRNNREGAHVGVSQKTCLCRLSVRNVSM